ncbi:MAG: hypothetical protein VX768_07740 [Planctomycetota bacterium]|nr:hypothetical protein [Planctomycetota bacterium]
MNAEKKENCDLDQDPCQSPKEDAIADDAIADDAVADDAKSVEGLTLTGTQVNWLIPSVAIGYVPFVFFLVSNSNDSYGVFVYSGLFLVYAIPVYAILLTWNTVKRFRNGTNNFAVTMYQLFSLIILFGWLMYVLNFNGSPA